MTSLTTHRLSIRRRELLMGMAAVPLVGLVAKSSAQAAPESTRWVGVKKIAFIPVYRPRMDSVPDDWEAQIEKRIYTDTDSTGADISLRTYIRMNSYGRGDLEGVILPRVSIDRPGVEVDALSSRTSSLRSQGFAAAAIVMLGGVGAGTAIPAGFWARFVMVEKLGTWAMELVHAVTGYGDLYIDGPGAIPGYGPAEYWFDNMASIAGQHSCAFTKASLGWIEPSEIVQQSGRTGAFDLHTIGNPQALPSGRFRAVRVGAKEPYLMVESREKLDPFDARIPGEGVIVYEVMKADQDSNPNVTKPRIANKMRIPLSVGQTYTSASGVIVRVTRRLAGGYAVSIDDPNMHLVDRSGQFGAPAAASVPTVCLIPGLGGDNIAYRDASGSLFELWRDARGQGGAGNLTASAGAPKAVGNPFAYADTRRNTEILLYRASDGVVRSLYWSTGAVGHDNLSGTAGAPKTASDPVGYYIPSLDTHHVIYRGADGHLHELNCIGTDRIVYGGNLTGTISAPRAAGDPSAFANRDGINIVAYRAVNGHVMSVYWNEGPSGLDDLSGVANTPAAAGDPVGYYTPHDDTIQFVYLGNDGHLWELYSTANAPVTGWDLTAQSAAPTASANRRPACYYSAGTNTKHVIYSTPNGRLHEIWWTPGGGTPQYVDMTARYGLPPAADRPAAFATENPSMQHVAYRGADGHLYEVLW